MKPTGTFAARTVNVGQRRWLELYGSHAADQAARKTCSGSCAWRSIDFAGARHCHGKPIAVDSSALAPCKRVAPIVLAGRVGTSRDTSGIREYSRSTHGDIGQNFANRRESSRAVSTRNACASQTVAQRFKNRSGHVSSCASHDVTRTEGRKTQRVIFDNPLGFDAWPLARKVA